MSASSGPPSELLRQLLEPQSAETAATTLAKNPLWLGQRPPLEVLTAFGDPRHPYDGAVVRLAQDWEPEVLGPSILQALDEEDDPRHRQRLAWIAKQTATESLVPELLARAETPDEDRIVRRYLLEAVSRLGFGGIVDWPAIEKTVLLLVHDPEVLVREAATALAGIGEGHDAERRAVLIDMLRDPDASVVATAASGLKRYSVRETDIPAELARQLLDHQNPLVRLTVQELFSGSEE